MKRIILMVWMAGLLVPAGLMAQKVYKDGNQVILDLTETAGMPAGAITSKAKYTSFTPSATVLGANNKVTEDINATVYKMLEVAKKDMTGTGGFINGRFVTSWVDAFNYCTGLGNRWRLPTQRELMLMFVFKPALENLLGNVSGSEPFSLYFYWSATEESKTDSWNVNFTAGDTGVWVKTNPYHVRCVREIP